MHPDGDVEVTFPMQTEDLNVPPECHVFTFPPGRLLRAVVDFKSPPAAERMSLLTEFTVLSDAKVFEYFSVT